jgi:anhydro-N-acetylmuramic acid kinase
MKQHVEKLHSIANKGSRRIIGLMSGTSLDGLDIALCYIENSGTRTQVRVEHFTTVTYTEDFRNQIRKVFAEKEIDFQHLCVLNPFIGIEHGKMIAECLKSWNIAPDDVDLIASHGQTVYHAPKKQHQLPDFPNATLQIGDGDHIAVQTGIITLSDFRQKHIAAGGEGAPLAVYGDYFLFSKKGENRILLNMGGIANFTILPYSDRNDQPVFTTDTGPGNTLIDAYMRKYFDLPYDHDGEIAKQGTVNEALLNTLKMLAFFEAPFPKTTGPEVFSVAYVEQAIIRTGVSDISPSDLIATLTRFSADTITDAIKKIVDQQQAYHIFASGGGAHNQVLMRAIQNQLPAYSLQSLDKLGISGDAKEAVLFAVLANEAVAGTSDTFKSSSGVPLVTMGKISFPG